MTADPSRTTPARSDTRRRVALFVFVAAVVAALGFLPVGEALDAAQDAMAELGVLGPVLFVLLYVAATVLFVPGSALTLFAGVQWDVALGTAIVSVASTAGAAAAFLVGRHLARDWVKGRIAGQPMFAAIDRVVARRGFRIVLLTRLSPVLPFNLLNYAYGVTSVPFGHFVLASWIGMLPGTVLYVYLGRAAAVAARGGAEEGASRRWIEIGVGLAVALAVAWYVGRLARAELQRDVAAAEAVAPEEQP